MHRRRRYQKTKNGRWALWILVGCIALLIAVYAFERVAGHVWHDPGAGLGGSNLAAVVTETLKFLTYSIIGFLFAKRAL